MCYLVAKDRDAHGCFALKTTHGRHLVELKRELNKAVGYKGIQLVTISRPTAYGEYTKELWIDRRVKSKSLAWSSIILALGNIKGEVVERPKALGDIRGVTYIYGMFYRFGLIDVPDEVKEKMGRPKDRKK